MIYIDMDGCIAKWNSDASVEETKTQGYFLKREPEKVLIDAIKILVEEGIPVSILSSVYIDGHSASDKLRWLVDVVDLRIPAVFVPYGDKKADYVSYGGILVDDYSINLHAWNKGVAIKFYNGINGSHGTWKGESISNQMTSVEIAEYLKKCIQKKESAI